MTERTPVAGAIAGSGAPRASSNAAWFERARAVIPGGVDSPVRSFAAVGGTPYTVARGEGPYVWDVEGRRYIDMVQSYGALLLGHAHPAVTAAVTQAALLGTTFGAPTPGEVLLAEAICDRVAGCEQVRLVSSGTEAAMSALRVARGFTGRDRAGQVRRLLSRALGHAAGRRGKRCGDAGPARVGRGSRVGCGRHHCGAVQRGTRGRRSGGLRDRGARCGQHGRRRAGAGFPRRAAGGVRRRRRPPRLRRGDHRVPGGPWGDVGAVGSATGPVVLRQGDGGWPSCRRLRGQARRAVGLGP